MLADQDFHQGVVQLITSAIVRDIIRDDLEH